MDVSEEAEFGPAAEKLAGLVCGPVGQGGPGRGSAGQRAQRPMVRGRELAHRDLVGLAVYNQPYRTRPGKLGVLAAPYGRQGLVGRKPQARQAEAGGGR